MRRASDQAEVDAALELRFRVFCGEQGVTLEADQDGRDAEALHIVAVEGGQLLGTCRLIFDGGLARLGRMAVETHARGRGLGARILEDAEREARDAGADRIRLHAQVDAQTLYARGGFATTGEEFIEEGIPHVTMEKHLA